MSYSQDSKMSWSCLNTKEDLLKMFTGHIDLDVIKLVIDIHQDNCKFYCYFSSLYKLSIVYLLHSGID